MSKLYAAIIPGGRAGEQMRSYTIDLTDLDLNDEETVEGLYWGEQGPYLEPNHNKDRKLVLQVIRGEKDMWVGWDHFGEGVIGITTKKELRATLATKTRQEFGDFEDSPTWDD